MLLISGEARKPIERLAEELFAVPDCKTSAACESLRRELFLRLYEHIMKAEQQMNRAMAPSQKVDDLYDVFYKFFEEEMWKYDPQKKEGFVTFFNARMSAREKDAYRRRQKRATLSLDAPIGEDEDTAYGDTLVDERDAIGRWEEYIRISDEVLKLGTLVLGMKERKNGTRKTFFRMFFTDSITTMLKHVPDDSLAEVFGRRERDLFRAMQVEFLDYYMAEVCRAVKTVIDTPLKPYGALVEGKPMDRQVKLPLPNDVFSTYMDVGENYIAQQKTEYKAFLKDIRGL